MQLVPAVMFDEEIWADEAEAGLKRTPVALSEDGWAEAAERLMDQREVSMHAGDLVLYRHAGELVPAALIEAADDGRWLARDSRHGRDLFHLAPESIAKRLSRS